MYELLYNKAIKDNLDVVRCNFYCVYTKTNQSENIVEKYQYPEIILDQSNKNGLYEKVCGGTVSCVIWNHIYRAKFLKQHALSFLDSRLICSEDSVFFLEVYSKIPKIGILSDYLYYHIFHDNNTGKKYDYRSIKNRISFFETLYFFLKNDGVNEQECLSYLSKHTISSLYTATRQVIILHSLSQAISELSLIKQSSLVSKCFDFLYKKENISTTFKLKPTIIAFSFLVKLYPKKQITR